MRGDASSDTTRDTANDPGEQVGNASSDGLPGSCPPAIVPCVEALEALRATCRGAGACQLQTEAASRRMNACYADGVRVETDPGLTAVLRGDGRLCYTLASALNGAVIAQTLATPAGQVVVELFRNPSLGYETIGCAGSYADLPDGTRPCGDLSLLPESLGCLPGTCLRP